MTDDDRVFKALADPTRRFLLDRLFERDGRTLTELESDVEMTRFGVMKHLRVLEDADLVVARRSGREKLHFLNPVPIRLIHDRWIDKYTERQAVGAGPPEARTREGGLGMTTETETMVTTQVYRVYIKASPQAVWDAIDEDPSGPSSTATAAASNSTSARAALHRVATEEMKAARAEIGGAPTPDVIVDGEVIEADPPHRLVQTWRMLMDPGTTAEGFTRLTYEIVETRPGVSKLTLTHELEGAPRLATFVGGDMESIGAGGGWAEALGDPKTLLETGSSFYSE